MFDLVRDALRLRDDDGAPGVEEELPHALVLTRLLPRNPRNLEANSIALLKSLLTSLLRFTVLKNSIYKTKKLNREVNRLFNRAIEFASCFSK